MFLSFNSLFTSNDVKQFRPKDVLDLDPDSYVIIDVREKWELEIAELPGSIHIPLGEIYSRLEEFSKEKKNVLLCHHGSRSQRAAKILIDEGIKNVANLVGGIDQWAIEIDTTLRRY